LARGGSEALSMIQAAIIGQTFGLLSGVSKVFYIPAAVMLMVVESLASDLSGRFSWHSRRGTLKSLTKQANTKVLFLVGTQEQDVLQ
jgi:hypothetical protein